MANKVTVQKLIDNNKRALLKYVILADGSATANSTLIVFSDLNYAINSTGQISNTNPKPSYSVSVKRVYGYSGMSLGYGVLGWQNDANTDIVSFSSGSFDYNLAGTTGDNAVIPSPAANTKGLVYTLKSPTSNDAITLFVDIRKDSTSYDAGQTADPVAFNTAGIV